MNIIGYRTVVLAVLALMGLAAHSQNNDDPNISGWDAPAGYYTLSIERFHHWDGCESWSQVIDDYASREIRLNETLSVGNVVYGHYAVMYNDYADLSGFYALQIEGTPGMKLRVLLNRKEPGVDWEGRDWDDHGGGFVELTPVISSEGKITVPFIGYDFVHLNAIKIHGESPEGQITALTMIKGAYEDPTTGPASGKYYLKNLATGRYWGIGNDYGTRASLVEDPEYIILHRQDNGTYLMETQTMNTDDPEYQNWKYFGGDFMDNEWAQPLVFSMVEDGWFTIRADNGCYYGNDGSSTVLGKWLDQNDWNTRWQILTEDQMINDLKQVANWMNKFIIELLGLIFFVEHLLKAFRHGIHLCTDLPEFILRSIIYPCGKITSGDLVYGPLCLLYGSCDVPGSEHRHDDQCQYDKENITRNLDKKISSGGPKVPGIRRHTKDIRRTASFWIRELSV